MLGVIWAVVVVRVVIVRVGSVVILGVNDQVTPQ